MEIINIKNNDKFLTEYIKACNKEWARKKSNKELREYIREKKNSTICHGRIFSIDEE